MNKKRAIKLPNRSDILYITKNWGNVHFKTMHQELNITGDKLITWAKLIFGEDEKEKRWRTIEDGLNELEMHENFDTSMASEYDVHDIRQISGQRIYIVKKKLVNENRTFYICTINHTYHYIVVFDVPVNRNELLYTNHTMGCDYEVNSLGQWEYMALKDELPVIYIDADEDYIGKFWLAMSNMVAHEA
jgi:hypothetical protein